MPSSSSLVCSNRNRHQGIFLLRVLLRILVPKDADTIATPSRTRLSGSRTASTVQQLCSCSGTLLLLVADYPYSGEHLSCWIVCGGGMYGTWKWGPSGMFGATTCLRHQQEVVVADVKLGHGFSEQVGVVGYNPHKKSSYQSKDIDMCMSLTNVLTLFWEPRNPLPFWTF